VAELPIDTPHGPARAHLREADDPWAGLVLGHGAGGGVQAPDLLAVTSAVVPEGVSVALVEQPYRVAGRSSTAPPHQLDAAWLAIMEHLRGGDLAGLPLVSGGRSAGARVACRTAAETGVAGVICLAFPLRPPQRQGKPPAPSRQAELDAVPVPLLIIQGENDRFGVPRGSRAKKREVVKVNGDHSLRGDREAIARATLRWLERLRTGPGLNRS
jgi:predicted alpha/beta-hydrolase family hydrolase